MKSEKYPNLYTRKGAKGWVFRKFSSARRDEFIFFTGTENEAKAYKIGLQKFNEWVSLALGGTTIYTIFSQCIHAEFPVNFDDFRILTGEKHPIPISREYAVFCNDAAPRVRTKFGQRSESP